MPAPSRVRWLSLLTLGLLAGSLNTAWAAESWMNERERAASAQRDLERLADEARRPNSKPGVSGQVDPEALCRDFGDGNCTAAEREAKARADADAQRQRLADEADQRRLQNRQALEAQFRAIDDASAELTDRLWKHAGVRVAAAQPLAKEGPTASNITEYCEVMMVYAEGYLEAGSPDPVRALRAFETALAIDEGHEGCWRGYAKLVETLGPYKNELYRRFDYSSLGYTTTSSKEAGVLIKQRHDAWRKASLQRQAVVQTFFKPETRIASSVATAPPERLDDWSKLKSAKDPEARYWQSRVYLEGRMGQTRDVDKARETACRKDAAAFFRNRVNCVLLSAPGLVPGRKELGDLVDVVATMTEFRDPKFYAQSPELPEIMARRADRAVGLARIGMMSIQIGTRIAAGEIPPPFSGDTPEVSGQNYRRSGCRNLEEAVALGYYDNDADVLNMAVCYQFGVIQMPTGTNPLEMFGVLERDGNAALIAQRAASAAKAAADAGG